MKTPNEIGNILSENVNDTWLETVEPLDVSIHGDGPEPDQVGEMMMLVNELYSMANRAAKEVQNERAAAEAADVARKCQEMGQTIIKLRQSLAKQPV